MQNGSHCCKGKLSNMAEDKPLLWKFVRILAVKDCVELITQHFRRRWICLLHFLSSWQNTPRAFRQSLRGPIADVIPLWLTCLLFTLVVLPTSSVNWIPCFSAYLRISCDTVFMVLLILCIAKLLYEWCFPGRDYVR